MTCVDCGSTTRKTPHPGPRCATCHRARLAAARDSRRSARALAVYGVTSDLYAEILAEQGGTCAICGRATGRTKALAIDHDHSCCPSGQSCGQCVRGLLCGPCNRLVGHLRDDPAALRRAADYLENPPAKRVINRRASEILNRLRGS
jgi:hypothetical protein